ncbi:MAG: MarR family transcriptional regulator [Rhodovibrionaceae bacterium]
MDTSEETHGAGKAMAGQLKVISGDLGYEYSDQVGHYLRKAYQRALAIFQKHCIDPNLTSVQFVALSALLTRGPKALSELGQLAAIDPSTTKGVVDRLKQRGLIEVANSPKDRRKTIISISAKGAELVEAMVEPGHRVTEDIMAPLNPAERVALVYLLAKIS